MPARILIVDDEPNILAAMRPLLASRGYLVATATSGRAALEAIEREVPDVIVLDLGLPDMDGVEVCRLIREERATPILILSARGAEARQGARARCGRGRLHHQAVRRRGTAGAHAGGAAQGRDGAAGGRADHARRFVIDRERNRVRRGDDEIRLTPKELDLLVFFVQHPGRVLTHRVLLKALWGPNAIDQPERLRVLVGALRKKIEIDPSRPAFITTEPWVGYRFVEE